MPCTPVRTKRTLAGTPAVSPSALRPLSGASPNATVCAGPWSAPTVSGVAAKLSAPRAMESEVSVKVGVEPPGRTSSGMKVSSLSSTWPTSRTSTRSAPPAAGIVRPNGKTMRTAGRRTTNSFETDV